MLNKTFERKFRKIIQTLTNQRDPTEKKKKKKERTSELLGRSRRRRRRRSGALKMIWRAEESVDRWLAGALAPSSSFPLLRQKRQRTRAWKGKRQNNARRSVTVLSSDKRAAWTYAEVAKSVFLLLFATLFRNGLGTRAPGRPSVSLCLANFRQISTRKLWF
jgi:hypothetical protein